MPETLSRIPELPANGKPKSKRKTKPRRRTSSKAKRPDHLRRWALGYVGLSGVASCYLNATAFAAHAAPDHQWAACTLGVLIPVLVVLLGHVAGLLNRRGHHRLAAALAAVGCSVLALSVIHCQQSIALLTGSGTILSSLLAIGIDCGLVGCEAAAMLDD